MGAAGAASRRCGGAVAAALALFVAPVPAGVTALPVAPAAAGQSADAPEAVRRPVPGEVLEGFEAPDVVWAPGTRGVKLAAAEGEPVRAALAGTVAFAGEVAGETWVTVDHGGGLDTTYGVVAETVVVGRRVRAGDVVGTVADDSGGAHWGARLRGEYVDPLSLLGRWRPRLVAPGG